VQARFILGRSSSFCRKTKNINFEILSACAGDFFGFRYFWIMYAGYVRHRIIQKTFEALKKKSKRLLSFRFLVKGLNHFFALLFFALTKKKKQKKV
jgi:hypothetical protein